MAYTVTKLAQLSGVSVRTLHWYDEVGLLKPAHHGANGYRHYEEEQLLLLQQILFFRELGFELKRIGQLLKRSDFNKLAALESHRKVLRQDVERTRRLIKTIDKTIKHLRGTKKMKDQEMYDGFDPKKQKKYEQQLVDYFGEKVKKSFAECERNTKGWTKADWNKSSEGFKDVCEDLVRLMAKRARPDSKEVQNLIRRHHQWLKQFWTPTKESYPAHAQFILETDLRKAYEAYHRDLPQFLADGIKVFAEIEL